MSTLQHVVLPTDRDPHLLALYLDSPERSEPLECVGGGSEGREEDSRLLVDEESLGLPELVAGVIDRSSVRVAAGAVVSFAAYFNAFPASHWLTWTTVRAVRLVVPIAGSAVVTVHASDAEGTAGELSRHEVHDGEVVVEVDLAPFVEGGWLWFDVAAVDDVVVSGARWEDADGAGAHDGEGSGLATLAITTMNKADYCVASLERLADDDALLAVVDRIVVVDQGTQLLRDQDGFAEVAERLGERLYVVEQPNLGGSGGFSRGMYEALRRPRSSYVVLLDDDVVIETEGLARAVRVARRARAPFVLGGHMLDLNHRGVLHAVAEIVDQYNVLWCAAPGTVGRHDFAAESLRQTRWLHRRHDADFNGWWMTLVPLEVLRDTGLSTPMFLKWDDAEFGLRAKAAGYPTVPWPGSALWHISWLDKDDGIDWQAYFHQRNRLVTAFLHAERPRGGKLLRDSFRVDVKHLLSMQYYTATIRHRAIRDVLDGPQVLRPLLAKRVGQVRALATEFPDAVRRAPDGVPDAPEVADGRPRDGWPRGFAMLSFALRYTMRTLLRPVSRDASRRPEARLAVGYGTWWRIPRYDSVLVPTADRQALFWYRRDRRTFVRLLRQSVALHWRLRREWDRLADQYRSGMPEEVTPESWAETFGLVVDAAEAPGPMSGGDGV